MTTSNFRLWRSRMQYTQDQAAARLGVSKSQVANWDAGRDRATGSPSRPGLAVRTMMAMLVRGDDIQPWPE